MNIYTIQLYPQDELHLTPEIRYDYKSIMHYGACKFKLAILNSII